MPENIENVLGDSFFKDIQKLVPRKMPTVDVFQTETEGIIVIEAPGITHPIQMQLELEDNKIYITGSIPYTYAIEKESLEVGERFFGEFQRIITLPFNYIGTPPIAKYEHGLLVVKIQKLISSATIRVSFDE